MPCGRLRKRTDDDKNYCYVQPVSEDFATASLQKQFKSAVDSEYLNLQFLKSTSNVLKRFVSSAAFAMNEKR